MANWKKLLITALVFGFGASVLLAGLEALHHNNAVAIAQFPGIVVGWQVGATDFAFEVVMVLINAVCYAAFAGAVLTLMIAAKQVRS